ncbi:flagellar protein FliS [Pseudomonas nitritireducens]|uniref:Flagellar secretion chaperone FliS n=1 Tax=Pseudomonas nitroreducens TaxID=46680 RepID=A0A7W7P3M2_PSENT|nr:flagellar export chaperone FliS [Pseudomonas nitritireducens]MBB4865402.1 flagellar protein FliS [Pseudomonas nitritireducens]
MRNETGGGAYARVSLESKAAAASPVGLVIMLYEGALQRIRAAKILIEAGDIPRKGEAITKAINIVGGLQAGLDLSKPDEWAHRLDALYTYSMEKLVQANLKNDISLLTEIESLLSDLLGGWKELVEREKGKA